MMLHKIKKGYDIKLIGAAEPELVNAEPSKLFALQPPDFLGIKPKLVVEVGDVVKIGTLLFTDKQNPRVKFLSPAAGKISLINRGERRVITEVVVEATSNEAAVAFPKLSATDIAAKSRDEIVAYLLEGGVWPYIRQRPFSKIADPQAIPRDIFISGLDTSPLAPDYTVLLADEQEAFKTGLSLLRKLTTGKVYFSIKDADSGNLSEYQNLSGVDLHAFTGPHPAGNVSVQIERIAPLKRGEIVWYIYAPDVILLGKLAHAGQFPIERIVAVAGSAVNPAKRKYYRTRLGASVQTMVKEGDLQDADVRFISGGVLRGRGIGAAGFLGFYESLLTIIPESNERKFLGWFSPGRKYESFSKTFLSKLFRPKGYILDTRLHGGVRAFIQTGEYEKVMPLDILPMHLVKSIIAEDIEEMEALGILECAPEDFALCTYICPSKIDFGAYVQSGLDLIEKEG
jgi:Na+-transporting NADH:ubiquinone oxidoreductase subunit A